MIEITNSILISEDELSFVFSRSPGPGGQNVNKLNTRVTVLFDLGKTSAFSDSQKNRIHKKRSLVQIASLTIEHTRLSRGSRRELRVTTMT